jgi:hypothetical protein
MTPILTSTTGSSPAVSTMTLTFHPHSNRVTRNKGAGRSCVPPTGPRSATVIQLPEPDEAHGVKALIETPFFQPAETLSPSTEPAVKTSVQSFVLTPVWQETTFPVVEIHHSKVVKP